MHSEDFNKNKVVSIQIRPDKKNFRSTSMEDNA